MNAKFIVTVRPAFCLALVLSQVACGWVDRAGESSAESNESANAATNTEVFVQDQPVDGASAINEQSNASITVAKQSLDAQLSYEWSAEPVEQGNLAVCENVNGFNAEFAADSFANACTNADKCELDFETAASDTDAGLDEFTLSVPSLDASVGVRHELSVTDDEGNVAVNTYSFCLIAINEAPSAIDDTFTVVEGDTLRVSASSVDNLLTNDSDDTDVTNQPLSIRTVPSKAPEFAADFSLDSDGGFVYLSTPNPSAQDRSDSFEYVLTDGVFDTTATATIRIVSVNQAPELLSPLASIVVTEGETLRVDVAANFNDPEAGPMSFSISPSTPLVANTGLSLSTAGVLSGVPSSADVGSYVLQIVASDGLLETEATLNIEVQPKPLVPNNERPVFVAGSVSSQSVTLNQPMVPIVPKFTDEQTLSYSINGNVQLPAGITINPTTGILSGTPSVRGVFGGLRVRATDPSGLFSLSTTFVLTVTLF